MKNFLIFATCFFIGLIVPITVSSMLGGCRGKQIVTPGIVSVIDTVIVHDTVSVVKTVREVTVREIVVPAVDTIPADTAVSYAIEQEFARGAHVRAELQSREFPAVPPIDLRGVITYLPPVDSIKIISRIDTMPKIVYKKPAVPAWQAITIGVAVGILGGIVAANR